MFHETKLVLSSRVETIRFNIIVVVKHYSWESSAKHMLMFASRVLTNFFTYCEFILYCIFRTFFLLRKKKTKIKK